VYLKSIELAGFKSFAYKVALDFKTPISAIVGPNGSGKSNIAEAFRFVLGEQSMKSMRGKRSEDLIFTGSKGVPRQGRAYVRLVFDNSKKLLDVDFPEVVIERVIHRDSSNEYLLNKSKVRLRDIILLLAGGNIGSTGHHIISQGEADSILKANPKERRRIIEDALGLKIFHYKKKISLRKLDRTESNIKEVESLRRELKPRLTFLRRQVEAFEKLEKKRLELLDLYKEYLYREDVYLEMTRESLEKEKKEPTAKYVSIKKELEDAREALERSKATNPHSQELESLRNELLEIRKKKDSLARSMGQVEGEILSLEKALSRLKKEEEESENIKIPRESLLGFKNDTLQKLDAFEGQSLDEARLFVSNLRQTISSFLEGFIKGESGGTNVQKTLEEDLLKQKEEKERRLKEYNEARGQEEILQKNEQELVGKIDEEKETYRDAEKRVFELIAQEKEMEVLLNKFSAKEEKLVTEELAYKGETTESVILVGREVLQYENMSILKEEILKEEREKQITRKRNIEKIKLQLEGGNLSASSETNKEYKEVEDRDLFLKKEVEDLEKTKTSLLSLIDDLDLKLSTRFKEGVEKINTEFQKFFSVIFGGGTASLVLIKEDKKKEAITEEGISSEEFEIEAEDEDVDEEGVDINVTLPYKNIRGLQVLSGGERALTSIALLFAISQVNPPPFIILDETDAALDEANSKRYGDMIENLSKHSQLILITHNRETMSRAGVLYGVTMGSDGVSKILSIEFEDAVRAAK